MKNIFIKIALCVIIAMTFTQTVMAENPTTATIKTITVPVSQYSFTLVIVSQYNFRIAAITIPNIPTANNCDAAAKLARNRPYTADAYCLAILKDTSNGIQK